MFRKKTQVRLSHKLISSQYGGGQTGTISHVISDYSGDLVPIAPSSEPTKLTCACGDSYMFQLHTKAEYRKNLWRIYLRRLAIFAIAHACASFGAFLAFGADLGLPLKIVGFILFIPGIITSMGMLLHILFSWPKTYNLEQTENMPDSIGSLRAMHGVKFS